MLGKPHRLYVGLLDAVGGDVASRGEILERPARALLAEVAGDGGAQLVERYGGSPQAKALRYRHRLGCDEDIGLQALHGVGRPQQGEAEIEGDVESEAPDDAVRE